MVPTCANYIPSYSIYTFEKSHAQHLVVIDITEQNMALYSRAPFLVVSTHKKWVGWDHHLKYYIV